MTKIENLFTRKLRKAGWYTYLHEGTGRMVTNAYERELQELEGITGVRCEVVTPAEVEGTCARIGPVLNQEEP